MGEILQVENLAVEVVTPARTLRAVDGVTFSLGEGEVLGLVGESGSGKTLTCRAVIGLLPSRRLRIADGAIRLDGHDITRLSEDEMRRVRGREIGMIFQNPTSHLDPLMTIGNQIAESLRVHDGLPAKEALEQAAELLRQVGVPDPRTRVHNYPHEFSGGMRQRAMIAAALACRPRILIADEPTTALDVTVQAQILRLLLELRDQRGLSIILVTHDLGVVAQACDAIAVMYGGQIVERAAKAELLRRPLHPYSRGLIASQPGSAEPLKELPTIPGQPPAIAAMPSGCRFHPRCSLAEEACRHEPPVLTAAAHAHETACRRWTALVEAA